MTKLMDKGKYLFTSDIHNWSSWGEVFQSIEAFELFIKHIFKKHNLPFAEIEHCVPGTNAVFKLGNFVVKIYAPIESGVDMEADYRTELFGIERANRLGISAPQLVARGMIEDRYLFRYIIMEHIQGTSLSNIESKMSDEEKIKYGKQLRVITDKMNIPCERFNDYNVVKRAQSCGRWSNFPKRFQLERRKYLGKYHNITDLVYVHGDLNPDNVLIDEEENLYIIDFADAVKAPLEYELAVVVCELFRFDKYYMNGYFGEYDAVSLSEACFNGLLLHDFGFNIIRSNLGCVDGIMSLAELKERLYTAIKNNEGWQLCE